MSNSANWRRCALGLSAFSTGAERRHLTAGERRSETKLAAHFPAFKSTVPPPKTQRVPPTATFSDSPDPTCLTLACSRARTHARAPARLSTSTRARWQRHSYTQRKTRFDCEFWTDGESNKDNLFLAHTLSLFFLSFPLHFFPSIPLYLVCLQFGSLHVVPTSHVSIEECVSLEKRNNVFHTIKNYPLLVWLCSFSAT